MKEDCFAYHMTPIGWQCSILKVQQCEYPFCKTYKTREMIIEQKKKCKARIDSYPLAYREYLKGKYGEYDTEEGKKGRLG